MSATPDNQAPEQDKELEKPTLIQVFASVLAAIFGVQKNANRERDFQKGDPKQFIAVYVFIVFSIVLGMIMLVRGVISSVS